MNPFERGPKQESLLDKARRIFIEAVSSTPIEVVPTDFDSTAVESLNKKLDKTNIFVLGEMHGVKENADIIYTFFKTFGFRQLALEWDDKLETVIQDFLVGKPLDFDQLKDSPDGRITPGHFAVIKKLNDEGLLDSIFCFDGGRSNTWNERDANMAKTILTKRQGRTLVIAGNMHAQTEMIRFDEEPGDQHPMGELVKQAIPELPYGEIVYHSGEFSNYGTQQFSVEPGTKIPEKARFTTDAVGKYTFELPVAHAAIVPDPNAR